VGNLVEAFNKLMFAADPILASEISHQVTGRFFPMPKR